MDISDIAHSLGALHEKTDAQTKMLSEIKDEVKDQSDRISKVEWVNTVWSFGKYFIGAVIGFFSAHSL